MNMDYIEFVDNSNPEQIISRSLSPSEITGFESAIAQVYVNPETITVQYYVAIFTRGQAWGKKTNSLVHYFDTKEERDTYYENIKANFTIVTMEGKWKMS